MHITKRTQLFIKETLMKSGIKNKRIKILKILKINKNWFYHEIQHCKSAWCPKKYVLKWCLKKYCSDEKDLWARRPNFFQTFSLDSDSSSHFTLNLICKNILRKKKFWNNIPYFQIRITVECILVKYQIKISQISRVSFLAFRWTKVKV